uniref:Uncharacterized protein n=1 Tax=Oryza nivara TaxID=4536 RepID=A0A0E0GVK9_ORYNI
MESGGASEQQRKKSKGRRRNRIFFVVDEKRLDTGGNGIYFVFTLNLKPMFADAGDDDDWATMRALPPPIARFDSLERCAERLDFALVGSNVVAVSTQKRTLLYDTAAAVVSNGPELRHATIGGTALILLGTRLYAMDNRPCEPDPCFQVLLPPATPVAGSGGRRRRHWSWRALPDPPADFSMVRPAPAMIFCNTTAFVAAGARIWVSAPDRGTYSFDTTAHGNAMAWRKVGDWELPWVRRAVFVPELNLCFAMCRTRYCLCAFDVPSAEPAAAAPVTRYAWVEETYPRECLERGYFPHGPASLAYLGDGRLCIGWTIIVEFGEQYGYSNMPTRFALLLMAVQVVAVAGEEGQLRLVKHKARCYLMSNRAQEIFLLQPSLTRRWRRSPCPEDAEQVLTPEQRVYCPRPPRPQEEVGSPATVIIASPALLAAARVAARWRGGEEEVGGGALAWSPPWG